MAQSETEILHQLNNWGAETLGKTLDIQFTAINLQEQTLTATMPVTPKVHQPYGILHGGASCVLAETLGSCLSAIFLNNDTQYAVGTNLNAYHLKSKKEGVITGTAKFIRKGKTQHVSEILIVDEKGSKINHTTMTNTILNKQ